MWQPSNVLVIDWQRPVAWAPLLLLNLLNAADALLSAWAIQLRIAVEGNPWVSAVGLPNKLAWVTAASLLLYRLSPRGLQLLVPVYMAVVIYTYLGLLL